MSYPGKGWRNMNRDLQKVTITGSLSADRFSYVGCSARTNTCTQTTRRTGDTETSPNCEASDQIDDPSWLSHCAPGTSPCNDIGGYCRHKNQPSSPAPCQGATTGLLDVFTTVSQKVDKSCYFVPLAGEFCNYYCRGQCLRELTCRGPVKLEDTMDLGAAKAWTLKDRHPSETNDLKLKTFAKSSATLLNATADVSYDFDLTVPMNDLQLGALGLWTTGFRKSTNDTTNTTYGGPGAIVIALPTLAQQVRDANFMLAASAYAYDNFFLPQFVGSTFSGAQNVLRSPDVLNYIHAVCEKVMSQFQTEYTDATKPLAIKNLLVDTIKPPEPFMTVDQKPQIKLFVNFNQLTQLLQNTSQVTTMISNFLRDTLGTVDRPGTSPTKGRDPKLSFVGASAVKAQMMILDENNYRKGNLIPVKPDGSLDPPSGYNVSNMVAVHYEVVCSIETWSIMLAAYFQEASYSAPDFSSDTCAQMQNNIPLVARTCFERANPDTQTLMLNQACPIKYTAPHPASGEEYWMLYADGVDPYGGGKLCSCFNANLGNPQDADKPDAVATSRCFSVDCTEDERQEVGLNDAVCSAPDKCELAELWVASKDPAERGRDLDAFDWVRFALLCGKTIQPLAEQYYSWQMAIAIGASLIALSVMGAVLLALLPKPKLPVADYWGIVVSLIVVSILLGVGAGWVFAGEPFCDGKKPICRSRLLKTPLMQASCPYKAQCECQFDQDCGGSCACTAGFCTSESGARDTKRVDQTVVKPEILVPLVFVAVAAAVIVGFATAPTRLGKGGASGVAIAVGLAFLGLALGLGITVDKGVLVFSDTPNCGNNLPATISVLDVARQVNVTFPTRSTWTPTGFPSGGAQLSQQIPYLIPAELQPVVEAEVQKVYPEFTVAQANRGMMFLSNNDDDPTARSFFVFEMPVTQKGNTIAVSRVQNTNNDQVDVWTVAWGKVSLHLDVIETLDTTVSVGGKAGKLYTQTTKSGETGQGQPIQTIGPKCLSTEDDADFFEAAKQALGSQWDGESYDVAFRTLQLDDAQPWYYYMQVNGSLAIACNYDHQFDCAVGPPSKDLAGFPCRTPT